MPAPARYRRACSYEVFIPVSIADLDVSLSGTVAAVVADSEAEIQALNLSRQPALAPLARLLLRTESVASSRVEGMQIDARTLARAEVANDIGQKAPPTALEILANIDAMQLAIGTVAAEPSVELDHLLEVHSVLLEHAPNAHVRGRLRSAQNWIGGNEYNPCGAVYVPPPREEVDWLLHDLCQFCSVERLPPLVQAAIGHAQFETIHPFEDGNGRTGRALIQAILRRRGLAPAYVPPISVVLAADKDRYIEGLTAYRVGHVELWLESFSVAAARAARLARGYLREVAALQDRWRAMLRDAGRIRADAAAWKLIEVLPALPVVTVPTATARLDRTKPAVNQAVQQLVSAGVLVPASEGRRNRAWEAFGLLDLLAGLEAGESPEGELAARGDAASSARAGLPPGRSIAGDPFIRRLLPFTDAVFRLSPGTWLIPPGETPELELRVAVALPDVLPFGGSGSTTLMTRLRGQRREELLIDLVEESTLGAWIRSLSAHRDRADVAWTAVGSGVPEFTELWFAPFGLENRRPAFMARCGFATGAVTTDAAPSAPALEAAIDLMFNVDDAAPEASGAKAAGTGEPLSLADVTDALAHLLEFVAVARAATADLLPSPVPTSAKVAAWISPSGGSAERVMKLEGLRRLPRSSGLGHTAAAFQQDLGAAGAVSEEWSREFVVELLRDGLERGGYRDLDGALGPLRGR